MKILHLISSAKGEASYSLQLSKAIVQKLQAAHPDSTVANLDLTRINFPHLEETYLQGFFTEAGLRTPEQAEAVRRSDAAIAELKSSDVIVIGLPMYNFSIPSTLKAWVDHIARKGETFSYSEKGPAGLVLGKKVYLAISTGGVYSEGAMKAYDFTEPYLRTVLGFMGMTDITTYRVEGTNLPALQEHALEKAIRSIRVERIGEPA